MRDELLAYLLNDLDDEQRHRIEERLEVDPIWQNELKRLRSYVEASQEQTDDAEPMPEDLVSRTCSFVKHASAQGELSPAVLPAKLSESQDAAAPRRGRWTSLDWAVGACIAVVIGALLVPAIQESRDSARRMQCQAKLKTLGQALTRYAREHNGQVPMIQQHENAGIYAIKLWESGVISREELQESLVCPSDELADDVFQSEAKFHVPTRAELRQAKLDQLKTLLRRMGGSFAYRIGFYDNQGRYHHVKFSGSSCAPMMADKPSYASSSFQSTHHGSCGQNVLFQDESVRYVQICIQTGPDKHWFLNEEEEHAAGTREADIVMGRSEARPSRTLSLINSKQIKAVLPRP